MQNLHNIEKSGFRRGEYVGYACGTVWKIVKDGSVWRANPRENADRFGFPTAPTLTELSQKIDRAAHAPGY